MRPLKFVWKSEFPNGLLDDKPISLGLILMFKRLFNRQSDPLHIASVEDPESFAGIVRLKLKLDRPSALSILSSEAEAPETHLGAFGAEEVVVNIHTHLLPAGKNSITIRQMCEDGQVFSKKLDLEVAHRGALHGQVARAMRDHGTPTFFAGHCDSRLYPYDAHSAWFDRPDALDHIAHLLEEGRVDQTEADNLRQFVEQGFLILEDLIDAELVGQVNAEIDAAIASGYQGYEYGSSQRIEHLHLHYSAIRKLWLDERHRRYVDLIFAARARPCQTLTYVFGSQQGMHQDTIHLTPFPAGYMCGTWIALQDIQPDSGELLVYPGSHRQKRARMADHDMPKITNGEWTDFVEVVGAEWARMAKKYEPVVYRPRQGTVLIWHENLLHAGSERKDLTVPRRSIVIHSFADGAVGYYDSTGLNASAASMAVCQ